MQQTIVSSHGISPSPFDWSWHFSGFSMCISQESLGRLFSTCPLSGKPEPAIQPGRLRPGGCHEKSRFTATQIVSEEAGPVCRRRRSRSKIEGVGVDDGTRTHDGRNHNPGLYQLSYVHQNSVSSPALEMGWRARQDSNLQPSA